MPQLTTTAPAEHTYQDLLSASKYARHTHKWASTTVSIGLAVFRNGKERIYHFDRSGRVVGPERDGQVHPWSHGPMSVSRDGHMC